MDDGENFEYGNDDQNKCLLKAIWASQANIEGLKLTGSD